MLGVSRLACSALRVVARTARPNATNFRQSLRGLSSGGSNTQATDEPPGPGPVLADLAKQADYPRDAMAMIDACPMEMRVELSQALSAAEDPVAELNLMVSTWLDPEANSASFEAGSVSLLDELKDEGAEESIDRDIDSILDALDLDFDDADLNIDDADLNMCNPEEEGMDANDDGVQAAADDDDAALNPLEKEDPSDWRSLSSALKAAKPGAVDEDLKHPWFSTRKLVEGAKLPEFSEAGSDPLKNVFGMSFESPPRSHNAFGSYKKSLQLYPGQQVTPESLNPGGSYERRHYPPRSKRLVRKRVCPFDSKRLHMPDHKAVGVISRFVSESGKILPRRRTGINAKNQRKFARVVKRARHFGLIPTTSRLQPPAV